MSSTGPSAGRYWPISSRKRWRRMPKRAQQYARTIGSSYARMILRTVALCIDPVAGPRPDEIVPRQPLTQGDKRVHALVAAGRPALLEEDDEPRRARREPARQLRAERADHRMRCVMEEVEVRSEE